MTDRKSRPRSKPKQVERIRQKPKYPKSEYAIFLVGIWVVMLLSYFLLYTQEGMTHPLCALPTILALIVATYILVSVMKEAD